jgi:hypothetical protein
MVVAQEKESIIMNQQEIFDTVVTHLFKQKHRAFGLTGCLYRTPSGEKCAAGVLIPDEYYKPEMEKKYINTIPRDWLPTWFFDGKNLSLIQALQGVHDNFESWKSPENMLTILDLVGRNYGLDVAGLKKFKKRKLDPMTAKSYDGE